MSENPYETPVIQAELADPRQRGRRKKPLPAVSLSIIIGSIVLACVLIACAFPHPVAWLACGSIAVAAMMGSVLFMVWYDLARWRQDS